MEPMAKIDRTDVGVAAQKILRPLIQRAVDACRHEADAALTIAEILHDTQGAVIRERLDRLVSRSPSPLRNTLQRPDREATRKPTRQLRGAKNPARGRRLGIAVESAQLRIATDAARVEQPFTRTVHDAAIDAEAEDPCSFDEEGAAFLIECLEGTEVDHRWIGFDLAKVGVHGGINGDILRNPVFDVAAGSVLLIALESRTRHVLQNSIGRQLEASRRCQPIESDDVAQL